MNRFDRADNRMVDELAPELLDVLRSRSLDRGLRSASCPTETECAAFIDGTISEPERGLVLTHLSECQHCVNVISAVVRLKSQDTGVVPSDLAAAALGLESDTSRTGSIGWPRWQVALSAAAGLVLLLGLPLLRQSGFLGRQAPGDQSPADTSDGEVRSGPPTAGGPLIQLQVLSPLEGATVDPSDLELRWIGPAGGLFFEVEIVSDDGDLIWQGSTESTTLRLPTDARLERGKGYFLWIRTHLPDGKTLKSPIVGFRVAARR